MSAHELELIRLQFGDSHFEAHNYQAAADILERMIAGPDLPEFLTLEAYEQLSNLHG